MAARRTERAPVELHAPGRIHHVAIVASLPPLHANQAASQRGVGTLEKSLVMLKALNQLGFGRQGSGLGCFAFFECHVRSLHFVRPVARLLVAKVHSGGDVDDDVAFALGVPRDGQLGVLAIDLLGDALR